MEDALLVKIMTESLASFERSNLVRHEYVEKTLGVMLKNHERFETDIKDLREDFQTIWESDVLKCNTCPTKTQTIPVLEQKLDKFIDSTNTLLMEYKMTLKYARTIVASIVIVGTLLSTTYTIFTAKMDERVSATVKDTQVLEKKQDVISKKLEPLYQKEIKDQNKSKDEP